MRAIILPIIARRTASRCPPPRSGSSSFRSSCCTASCRRPRSTPRSSAIGHDAQTTVTDPAFDERRAESGRLAPAAAHRRPVRRAGQDAFGARRGHARGRRHPQVHANSDVGGFLYGRTVIGSRGSPVVVTTDTVRGFVGLERNTQGLDAGATVGALGLDYETTPLGQFTDASADSPSIARSRWRSSCHGLHSIRHIMSAQGASDAKIPLAKDLERRRPGPTPSLDGRSFEMNRQGQTNPYTGLGISDDLGLLTYVHRDPPDDGLSAPPQRGGRDDGADAARRGDELLRRTADGRETLIARYLGATPDGTVTHRWWLSPAPVRRGHAPITRGSSSRRRRGSRRPAADAAHAPRHARTGRCGCVPPTGPRTTPRRRMRCGFSTLADGRRRKLRSAPHAARRARSATTSRWIARP